MVLFIILEFQSEFHSTRMVQSFESQTFESEHGGRFPVFVQGDFQRPSVACRQHARCQCEWTFVNVTAMLLIALSHFLIIKANCCLTLF